MEIRNLIYPDVTQWWVIHMNKGFSTRQEDLLKGFLYS